MHFDIIGSFTVFDTIIMETPGEKAENNSYISKLTILIKYRNLAVGECFEVSSETTSYTYISKS